MPPSPRVTVDPSLQELDAKKDETNDYVSKGRTYELCDVPHVDELFAFPGLIKFVRTGSNYSHDDPMLVKAYVNPCCLLLDTRVNRRY